MGVLELPGQIMNVKGSGDRASLPDLLAMGEIPLAVGITKKEEEEDNCSNDVRLIKRRLAKIRTWKGGGNGDDDHDCPMRQQSPMHNQVLKIKEEDSHLGEDVREVLTGKDQVTFVHHVTYQLWPRTVLPSSPLGANRAIKSFH